MYLLESSLDLLSLELTVWKFEDIKLLFGKVKSAESGTELMWGSRDPFLNEVSNDIKLSRVI